MTDYISATMLDRLCTSAGPARLSLLSMVRTELAEAATPPPAAREHLNPLRYLLEQVNGGVAKLDEHGLTHSYAEAINRRLGFDSPAWVNGDRTHLEVDTLLQLARTMSATMAGDGTEVITPIGISLLDDPTALWRSAAWAVPALPYANQQISDTWELILAWLLVDGEEFEAQLAAVAEIVEHDDALPEFFEIATCSLYTLARGLHMFVPRPRHVLKKPVFNDFGRATAIEALRSAALLKWNDFRSIA